MAAQTFPLDTICKLLDLTPQRVNQLVREGIIPKAERGRYELVPVVQAYIRYLRDRAVKGDVHGDDYSAHRTRLIKVRADLLEIEQEQIKGKLIPAEDVESAWIDVLSNCRAKLLSIPTKVSAEVFVANDLNDVKSLLKSAVNEALMELSTVNVKVKNPIRTSESSSDDQELAVSTGPAT